MESEAGERPVLLTCDNTDRWAEVNPAMKMERRRDLDRIIQDPAIMVGKPVVKGTRIPVERVIQHLAENPDLDDLFQAFPHLNLEDVKACLAY